jgi:hypothetical protein
LRSTVFTKVSSPSSHISATSSPAFTNPPCPQKIVEFWTHQIEFFSPESLNNSNTQNPNSTSTLWH